jgi:NADPH:quinone reductase-like Zn-dependent oxidoreductase
MQAIRVDRYGTPDVLRLPVDHVLPLGEAAEAQRLLEERKSIGKIILEIR